MQSCQQSSPCCWKDNMQIAMIFSHCMVYCVFDPWTWMVCFDFIILCVFKWIIRFLPLWLVLSELYVLFSIIAQSTGFPAGFPVGFPSGRELSAISHFYDRWSVNNLLPTKLSTQSFYCGVFMLILTVNLHACVHFGTKLKLYENILWDLCVQLSIFKACLHLCFYIINCLFGGLQSLNHVW